MSFVSDPFDTRYCLDYQGRLVGDDDDETYTLCLVQYKDLPDVSKFIVASFGAEAISLSSDLNAFERVRYQRVSAANHNPNDSVIPGGIQMHNQAEHRYQRGVAPDPYYISHGKKKD